MFVVREVRMRRSPPDAGFAIGPILFVLALLGILAAVIAAGSGDFSTASVADRVYNDIYSQANLIRTKINECNLKWGTNNNGDGYPASDPAGTLVCALACIGDPSAAQGGNDCAGNPMTQQNLWNGMRPALLPPPTSGFNQWNYVNAGSSGGRCIWTQPSATASQGVIAGLTKAASKFSSQEVTYDSAGNSQNFVIWITVPTGAPSSLCTSN
jgi:type II secretory pathway pseudopilin PulG